MAGTLVLRLNLVPLNGSRVVKDDPKAHEQWLQDGLGSNDKNVCNSNATHTWRIHTLQPIFGFRRENPVVIHEVMIPSMGNSTYGYIVSRV